MHLDLKALTEQVRNDLARTRYATASWTHPMAHKGTPVLDVAIIGGGQGGLTTCFALRRQGVGNTEVFERRAKGSAGPWTTFARMITLRTPKHVTGPDLGIPSLTPQSWYEACHGAEAWGNLDKISRQDWQAYLDWFRDTLKLPVTHDQELIHVGQEKDGILRLIFRNDTGKECIRYTRKLVLATGIDGGGRWHIPDFISTTLPKTVYAHTHETIDFEALRDRRIGVLGAGASAFDNAATALEAGARSVDLCLRRSRIPAVNPYRWMENAGFLAHFSELPDLIRWRFMNRIYSLNQPPPQDTFWRCRRHPNFAFHPATPWWTSRMDGNEVLITTPHGDMRFDFLVIGTGFTIDLDHRLETRDFAKSVLLWRDAFTPPEGEENNLLGSHPYLGSRFQFQPRDPADPKAAMLSNIHNFTFATMPSMGLSGASISGMRFGVEKLARGIARDLFVTDGEQHLASLLAYDTEELVSLDLPSPNLHGPENCS